MKNDKSYFNYRNLSHFYVNLLFEVLSKFGCYIKNIKKYIIESAVSGNKICIYPILCANFGSSLHPQACKERARIKYKGDP